MLDHELRQRLADAAHHAKLARMHGVAAQIAIQEILRHLKDRSQYPQTNNGYKNGWRASE